jgi:O-antigen/teichoic acid export membrane protein
MRLYYDCRTEQDQQRLSSTLFLALLVLNGVLLALGWSLAPWISAWLFDTRAHTLTVRLMLLNTTVIGFYFLPFNLFRVRGKAAQFSALTFARATLTLVARLVLVIGYRRGVLGVVQADLAVTAVFTLVLAWWMRDMIRPVFSRAILADALRFGLPRVPHGVALQVMAQADRFFISWFGILRDVGLYSIGATFALALKLFLSAFEYAWSPFYFAAMKDPNAKQVYSTVATYVFGLLVLLASGLSAVAVDVVRLMTDPRFHGAAAVIPWIAIGVVIQGAYHLTSIGLAITKKTKYYPLSTLAAALVGVGANVVLIPRYGIVGAAWANNLSYLTLFLLAFRFSQRKYPIGWEIGRMVKLVLAGLIATAAARVLVPPTLDPLIAILVRGTIVVVLFPLVLYAAGFYRPAEWRLLVELRGRLRPAPPKKAPETAEMAGELLPDQEDPGEEGNGNGRRTVVS